MPDEDLVPDLRDKKEYNRQIESFLDEFISIIYRGHDHIVARKYYRDLFQQIIPKYFDMKTSESAENQDME